jgi:ring-1,2-phenylacetyl-CoA epoxidase subunit PaaC
LFDKAGLKVPDATFMQHGSRSGVHTEHLGYILAEMQHLPRMYPTAKW